MTPQCFYNGVQNLPFWESGWLKKAEGHTSSLNRLFRGQKTCTAESEGKQIDGDNPCFDQDVCFVLPANRGNEPALCCRNLPHRAAPFPSQVQCRGRQACDRRQEIRQHIQLLPCDSIPNTNRPVLCTTAAAAKEESVWVNE